MPLEKREEAASFETSGSEAGLEENLKEEGTGSGLVAFLHCIRKNRD